MSRSVSFLEEKQQSLFLGLHACQHHRMAAVETDSELNTSYDNAQNGEIKGTQDDAEILLFGNNELQRSVLVDQM